jgi:predicted amidohydrolase YtcJ
MRTQQSEVATMDDKDQLAIINARVWTGNPRRPWADAVLIRGDRIDLVGSSAEVRKRTGPACRRIDARGMLLVPLWKDTRREVADDALIQAVRSSLQGNAATALNVLEAGAPADLALIDRDITRASPDDLGIARVILVMVAGRVLLDRAGLSSS